MKTAAAAFVLIEMMVLVAFLGIVLAMIVPGYQQQLLNGYRLEATQELQKLAILQQQFYIGYQHYTDELSLLSAPDDSYLTASGRFRISVSLQDRGYLLQADAVGPQRKDLTCLRFRLDQAGSKLSSPGTDCWQ